MKKNYQHILIETEKGVTRITLNRPEIHNAFNDVMIQEMTDVFTHLDQDSNTRAVLLLGAGDSFCAGADLNWMKSMAHYGDAENIADAKRLHEMLQAVAHCSKPVLARIQGPALGGGVGLVAAVDMAYAEEEAVFAFTEVRLGLIPAVISPFVLQKVGVANAREYFLTGERFSAEVAKDIGLVQGVGTFEEVEAVVLKKIKSILGTAPEAVAECKRLIRAVQATSWDRVGDLTSQKIAERRASEEGQEGMTAFLEKRKPNWIR